jgi:hypothetical protein
VKAKFCGGCGQEAGPGQSFCHACGSALPEISSLEPVATTPIALPHNAQRARMNPVTVGLSFGAVVVLLVAGLFWLNRGSGDVSTSSTSNSLAVTLSRDTRLAIDRCRQAVAPPFVELFAVRLSLGGPPAVPSARAPCSEAKVQLVADNPSPGSPGAGLVSALSELDTALLVAVGDGLAGSFDAAAQKTLQDAVDSFDSAAALALAS